MKLTLTSVILMLAMTLGASASVFASPDLANGKRIDQQKCFACHATKSAFGNGDMIYTRSDSKVTSFPKLMSRVAMCNTELRLDLFPEDEADVAAFLNSQFYKFKP